MRRGRRKGGNKEKVFGCDLLEHLATSGHEIPQVLRSCSEFVEEHGVVDGIYRLSGVSSNTQKLRGEFDSEGTPDLNKDVYLQDIHCVSSVCKAYFRELPNPLLTYQLYDKFAEAVAIQLEEERLVKIRDVLKELPASHFRTLEFLMRHLVRMASFSSQTNMHSRNLAIVWAPNLLRSKDIEVSGLNGTAAFMEVRVQSIVVEFILNHVPQLFPEQGAEWSGERRKSLPSPSAMSSTEFFRSIPFQSPSHIGNISPGDGPIAMRPYHAIIEGTDKRKGSLKGKKWKSIFNLGGRITDPRRRYKNSSKEKDKPILRPAKSMDSLSCAPFQHEGSGQRPPSSHMSPLALTPCPQTGGSEAGSSGSSGGMSNSYAVTYRRGAGASVSVVSGGGGTPGTYSPLETAGTGSTGAEPHHHHHQSRSPGISSKVGRRAGIHISGPLSVTVPLHITSGLAMGVLQGVAGDMGIFRGFQGGGETMHEKVEKEDRCETEANEGKSQKEEEVMEEKVADDVMSDGRSEERGIEKKGEEEEGIVGGEVKISVEDSCSEADGQDANNLDDNSEDGNGDYMDMKGSVRALAVSNTTEVFDVLKMQGVSVLSDPPELPEEDDDQALPFDFHETFGFLDLMDSSASNQLYEFSVEPPCHDEEDYEDMCKHSPPRELLHRPSHDAPPPANTQALTPTQNKTELNTPRQSQLNIHRPLTVDKYGRPNKSLSLPYMAPPFMPAQSSSSSEIEDDEDDNDEEEDMFCKSLPSGSRFNNLTWGVAPKSQDSDSTAVCRVPVDSSRSSEDRAPGPSDVEPAMCRTPPPVAPEQSQDKEEKGMETNENLVDVKDADEDKDGQDEDRKDTLTSTCTQSTETEDATCSFSETTKEEEALEDIDGNLTFPSSAAGSEEAQMSGPPDQEDMDVKAQLLVKDIEEVMENYGRGKSSEVSEQADTHEAPEDPKAFVPQVCQTKSGPVDPETTIHVPAEVVIGSIGVLMEELKTGSQEEAGELRDEGEEGYWEDQSEERVLENQEDEIDTDGEGETEKDGERDKVKEVGGREDETVEEEPNEDAEIDTDGEGETEKDGERDKVKEVGGREDETVEEEPNEEAETDTDGDGETEKDVEREMVKEMGEREDEVEEETNQGEPIEVEEERVAGDEDQVDEGTEQYEDVELSPEVSDDMDGIVENGDKGDENDDGGRRDREDELEGNENGGECIEVSEQDEREEETGGENGEMVNEKGEESDTTDEQTKHTCTENERKADDIQTQVAIENSEIDLQRGNTMEKDVTEDGNREIVVSHLDEDVILQEEREGWDSKDQDREDEGEGEEKMKEGQTQTFLEQSEGEPREIPTDTAGGSDAQVGLGPGLGRKVLVTKQTPKVHHVKSVPVVPPKPQHCRLTVLSIRHQHQERERKEADRDRQRVWDEQVKERDGEDGSECDKLCEREHAEQQEGQDDSKGRREKQEPQEGEGGRRREGDDWGGKEMARRSPISRCFDEAVAMATMMRGREKECAERERQRERGKEAQ
ncbi:uncharacterized protein si:dkeyp-68b7.12 [Osmerus eperlanus]|uniref:uncharacterized protein si:dkeyp-68b7.12 n=1 Tax=Osmerus eperlanus TaxID=29151 RepID=UPI002E146703